MSDYVEQGPEFWHALLIGIAYSDHENEKARLDQPHNDVRLIKGLLLGRGWLEKNNVILSDEKPTIDESSNEEAPPQAYPEPNKENILQALEDLIQPALKNPTSHKFLFYYAGHGAQEPDPTGKEIDGMNECIVPLKSLFPSDMKFEMKVVKRSGRGLSSEQLAPQATEDHGWINDDTLCELLCKRLPENCRLRAFFDMCHSGTALDLDFNYTWSKVPFYHLWRFNFLEAYSTPCSDNKRWLWPRKPQPVDATPRTRPGPRRRFTRSLTIMKDIPATVATSSKWTFNTARRVMRDAFFAAPQMSASKLDAVKMRAVPVIVTPVEPIEPTSVLEDIYTGRLGCSAHLLVGTEGATDRLPIPLPTGVGRKRRSVSALPAPRSPEIPGDIVCLGASADSQRSSDKTTLAKLLTEMYARLGEDPTHYQLLLWITRGAPPRQVPQLSSSRDLSNDWHLLFLV